jgi:hypothetical protein
MMVVIAVTAASTVPVMATRTMAAGAGIADTHTEKGDDAAC